MTPESQRIAIAEACPSVFKIWTNGDITAVYSVATHAFIDPLNDLNAMHEAEKVLTGKQIDIYREYFHSSENYGMFSTAAQRAERFLKVLRLWKEEPVSAATVEGLR